MSAATHQLDNTDEFKEWQKAVGERVCISGVKQGILRYFGRTNFANGYWCGVELDEPVGKNNGTVKGVVYFNCKTDHGIFAPVSKISKLDDLSFRNWRVDSKQAFENQDQVSHSNWDYNVGIFPDLDASRNLFIKSSVSDPSSLKVQVKTSVPHCSKSFPYNQQRDGERTKSLNGNDFSHIEGSDLSLNRQRITSRSSSLNGLKSSSRSISKYGYSNKSKYIESCFVDYRDESIEHQIQRNSPHFPPLQPNADVPYRNSPSDDLHAFAESVKEYNQFHLKHTKPEKISSVTSEVTSLNETQHYEYNRLPASYFNTFQSHDYSDLDDDEQLSADFDESLGILTPSQMRDLTLGADFRSSSKNVKGAILDFPSSESFDDINELPEDEQLHDVSVKYLPETNNKNYKTNDQMYSANRFKNFTVISECQTSQPMRKTDDFFYNISHKEVNGFKKNSSISQNDHFKFSHNFIQDESINDPHVGMNFDQKSIVPEKVQSSHFETTTIFKNIPDSTEQSIQSIPSTSFTHYASLPTKHNVSEDYTVNTQQTSCVTNTTKEMTGKSCVNIESTIRANEIEKSGNRVIHAESDNTLFKEKLTVSWEDCLSHSSDNMLNSIERPESVYTACSNDTGFHEDGDFEGDAGMTTSVESTDDAKRFSVASRDSCLVTEEIDNYKIAESNTTSGYSTGLSDSCCNDRHEDDLSSKRFTDEDILDACDSEDAFSFQDVSIGKDADVVNAENSEVTTENTTAVCNNSTNSTAEAFCETMVEDSTLSEIHNLLFSPEKSDTSPLKDENTGNFSQAANGGSEGGTKESENTQKESSNSETEGHKNNSPKSEAQRSAFTSKPAQSLKSTKEDTEKSKEILKSPKKNVMSKIKAMIESTASKTITKNKCEAESNPKKPPSAPKKSRWDAVTSKIAASLAEEKSKPRIKREIRSRVNTNLSSARQGSACNSPKLDSARTSICGEESMSPASVSSRDRKTLYRNNIPNGNRDQKTRSSKNTKDSRPGKPYVTSRSNSPVSSTTSVSINSHNSRSKIAHWKASSSTIASNAPVPLPLKPVPATKRLPPTIASKRILPNTASRDVTKRQTVPKIRITPAAPVLAPPSGERVTKLARQQKITKEQAGAKGQPTKAARPPMWLSKAELGTEIQRLSTLCEARTKELTRLRMETKHVSAGFDAFAALFKYMVEDLNGLSVPVLSDDLERTLKQLELAKQDLAFYEREVEEIKAIHCQELNDLSNKLFEVYQGEITDLSVKHQEELNRLKYDYLKQIEDISSNFKSSSLESQVKQDFLLSKLQQELSSQREELQTLHEQELKDLEERHDQSCKLLNQHIEQLQKKCADLKQHSLGMEDAMRKDTDTKLQWVSSKKGDLEKEVESLKAVLEMRNKELHNLRVQSLEMEKQLEDLPLAREKIKMLQARAEDLEALMIEKTKTERKLSTDNQQLQDTCEKETKMNKRLSMENEELLWRLRQAESSLLTGSYSEVVSEHPEEENESITPSPDKSPAPQSLSRSVFFTFVDKDDNSGPRTPYKKITPGFSANYKTSPCRSTKSTPSASPYRSKSHSEPPLLCSTPRKSTRSLSNKKIKIQRTASDTRQSLNDTYNVSNERPCISSESTISEQRDILMQSHEQEIRASLEILIEQRSCESASEPTTPCGIKSPNFENGDMSRSAEFSDPKTYYHMTFSDVKEPGIMEYDGVSVTAPNTESMHSIIHSDTDINDKLISSASGDMSVVRQA